MRPSLDDLMEARSAAQQLVIELDALYREADHADDLGIAFAPSPDAAVDLRQSIDALNVTLAFACDPVLEAAV